MTVPQKAHRSYSQLTSWLRCGYQYKLARIDKVPQHPSWWLVGGKAVHTATETYDRNPELYVSDRDVQALWHEAWTREYDDTLQYATVPPEEWRAGGRKTKEKPNKEDGTWWQTLGGRPMLQAWIDFRKTYPNWVIATLPDGREGIEVEFNVWIGDTPVRAFVDRIFDVTNTATGEAERICVDLKTGSRAPGPQQVGFYSTLYEIAYGERIPLGCYWMARQGDITVPENLDTYDLKYWAGDYAAFDTAVLNKLFIKNPGQACHTCDVARYCSAVRGDLAHEIGD